MTSSTVHVPGILPRQLRMPAPGPPPPPSPDVLVVDDEAEIASLVAEVLRDE
jgi:hypothetical protein